MELTFYRPQATKCGPGKYLIYGPPNSSFSLGMRNSMMSKWACVNEQRFYLNGPFYFCLESGNPTISRIPDELEITEGSVFTKVK